MPFISINQNKTKEQYTHFISFPPHVTYILHNNRCTTWPNFSDGSAVSIRNREIYIRTYDWCALGRTQTSPHQLAGSPGLSRCTRLYLAPLQHHETNICHFVTPVVILVCLLPVLHPVQLASTSWLCPPVDRRHRVHLGITTVSNEYARAGGRQVHSECVLSCHLSGGRRSLSESCVCCCPPHHTASHRGRQMEECYLSGGVCACILLLLNGHFYVGLIFHKAHLGQPAADDHHPVPQRNTQCTVTQNGTHLARWWMTRLVMVFKVWHILLMVLHSSMRSEPGITITPRTLDRISLS